MINCCIYWVYNFKTSYNLGYRRLSEVIGVINNLLRIQYFITDWHE